MQSALFIGRSSNLLTKSLLAQCSPCGAKGFFYLGHQRGGCVFGSPFPLRNCRPLDLKVFVGAGVYVKFVLISSISSGIIKL